MVKQAFTLTREMFFVILALTLVAFVAQDVSACSCPQEHGQAAACRSGYAFKGRVYGRKLVGLNGATKESDPNLNDHLWRFTVRVQRVFKGKFLVKKKWQHIWTPANSALCGTSLSLGKSMILTGSYQDNKMMTNACNWNQKWETLSIHQKSGLKSDRYLKHCNRCYNRTQGELLCEIPSGKYYCYNKFASCTRRRRNQGKCAWQRGPGFKNC